MADHNQTPGWYLSTRRDFLDDPLSKDMGLRFVNYDTSADCGKVILANLMWIFWMVNGILWPLSIQQQMA